MTDTVPGGVRSSEATGGELRLVLDNTLDAIEDGRLAIRAFLVPYACSDRAIGRLEVIFEELVSNIVRHGFEAGSANSMHVLVSVDSQSIILTIEDDGVPFDPLERPEPGRFESLETARIGGLGIPLVRKLSQSVEYRQVSGEGDGLFRPNNQIRVAVACS